MPFLQLSRNLRELDHLTAVSGTVVSDGGAGAGAIQVVALARVEGAWQVVNHATITSSRFVLRVDAGTDVRVIAFSPTDLDEALRAGGSFAVSGMVETRPGRSEQALSLKLSREGAAALDPQWVQAMRGMASQEARALPVALGQLATLSDPMFDESVSSLGLWAPADFLGSVGGGVYMLQPYRPDRIPVVLVHGAGGSPRDMAAIASAMNRAVVQPWVFHYPSGLRLDGAASMLEGILQDIAQRKAIKKLCLVAHSMGGLVSRAAVLRLSASRPELRVPLLATISSPWGGHAAAAWGVRLAPAVVPSWLDMQVGSAFQARLQNTPLPQSTAHHLHFSYRGNGDDGTVSLASQLVYPIQSSAARVRGHDEDHMSILGNTSLITEIRQATEKAA